MIQSLDVNGLLQYCAHEDEYLMLTFQKQLAKFTERYGVKLQKVIDTSMNSPQAPNEDVRSYCDKLLNLARPLLPPMVPQRKIIPFDCGQENFICNPFYDGISQGL